MTEEKRTDSDPRITQGRSPAYPYIDLSKAVEKIELIRDAGAARASMPPETFYKIWNLGAQSSAARQTMAALNHFGLVEYIGRGDDRKVKLSELGLTIALDKRPDSTERAAAIREAALSPPIHQELYDKYSSFLPADVVLETHLVKDRGYNDGAAQALIGEYKATLAFSGLDKPVNMPVNTETKAKEATPQVTPQATPAAAEKTPDPRVSKVGVEQDIFVLDEGQVVFEWPKRLSRESFEDVERWMAIQLRKIKRRVVDDDSSQGDQ